MSRSSKAGLLFSVHRIDRKICKGKYADRVSDEAAVYMTTVLEYLTMELLELAVDAAHDNRKTHITSRYVKLAVRNDKELNTLFGEAVTAQDDLNKLDAHIDKKASKLLGKMTIT